MKMLKFNYYCSICDPDAENPKEITVSDAEERCTCKKCKNTMNKMPSGGNFHLKGGGWYTDGYSGSKDKKSK